MTSTKVNFFCSATERPDCLKDTNLCCLHCDLYSKCVSLNTKKVKPCNVKVIGMDEYCEFEV